MKKEARAALLIAKRISRAQRANGGKIKFSERAFSPSPALAQLNDGTMSGFDPSEAALRIARELTIPARIQRPAPPPNAAPPREPMAYAPVQRREPMRALPPNTPATMPIEPSPREETLWDVYNRTENPADFVRADKEMMARRPMADGGVLEGEQPRNLADAQRLMQERRDRESKQSQEALRAELAQLQATPEWQQQQAEEISRQSFSPQRMQSMSPPVSAESLGLPSFASPQSKILESEKATDLARTLENEQRRKELGAALKETWPVKLAEDTYAAAKMPGEALAGRFDPQKEPERAIKGMFDLAGVLTSGGLPLASRDPNTVNLFGSLGAKTANLEKLRIAEQMEAAGAPVERIWQESGWWRAPDGKWRFEIPDQAMQLGRIREGLQPLEIAIDHEAAFKAYPELRDIPIRKMDLGSEGAGGYYQPGPNNQLGSIVVNSNLDPERARSVVLHEMQHVIQHRENLAAGASPDMFQFDAATINNLKYNRDALEQASDVHSLMAQGYKFDEALAFAKKSYADEWLPEADQFALADPQRIIKNLEDINLALKLPRRGGHEGYMRTAGEVEARNVEGRAGPSPSRDPEERLMNESYQRTFNEEMSPALTQEFGPREQVFRRWEDLYGANAMSSPAPRQLSEIGLYSHGQESAASLPQAKGTPQQMRAMLERAGVKPDELKGFEEAFAGQKQITREQAAKFFEERMPKVQETVLRGGEADFDRAWEQFNRNITTDDQLWKDFTSANDPSLVNTPPERRSAIVNGRYLMNAQDYVQSLGGGFTKYADLTLPYSENYREVLLRLPGDKSLPNGYKAEPHQGGYAVFGPQGEIASGATEAAAIAKANERIGGTKFQSSHWDEPNVLAHIRMADRTGPNGQKILHVEEMQSDWGQAGRKEGFKSDKDLSGQLKELNSIADKNLAELKSLFNGRKIEELSPEEMNRWRDLALEHNNINARIKELEEQRYSGKIEQAPYVTSTQGWTDLALKRILKEAVDNGYDQVVWTPGAEQAERYGLSQQVRSISYNPEQQTLIYRPFEHRGAPPEVQGVTKDKLASYVGQEPADRLLKEEVNESGYQILTGAGLTFGGQGMIGYYDRIVPAQLQKMLKKIDPQAKIGKQDIESINTMSINITPKIREAVRKGLPAFKRGGVVRKAAPLTDVSHAIKVINRFGAGAAQKAVNLARSTTGDARTIGAKP